MSDDWGSGPPPVRSSLQGRVEDSACRTVLRMAGLSAGAVCRPAKLHPATPLTFQLLVEHVEFPVAPYVTAVSPDDPKTLFTRFHKSNLWREWVAYGDDQAYAGPSKNMVMRGPGWGSLVVTDRKVDPTVFPHIMVGHGQGGPLLLLPFRSWCASIGWQAPLADTSDAEYNDSDFF